MVSEFVYRDHSRNDAYTLHSYTRVSCVDGTSKIIESPRKVSGVMKWTLTVENSGLLGATVLDLKELPRPHPIKRICGMCTRCTLLTNTHMVTCSLSFRKACVFVCVRMCACGYARMCSVTPSRAQSWIFFFARTVDPR